MHVFAFCGRLRGGLTRMLFFKPRVPVTTDVVQLTAQSISGGHRVGIALLGIVYNPFPDFETVYWTDIRLSLPFLPIEEDLSSKLTANRSNSPIFMQTPPFGLIGGSPREFVICMHNS